MNKLHTETIPKKHDQPATEWFGALISPNRAVKVLVDWEKQTVKMDIYEMPEPADALL